MLWKKLPGRAEVIQAGWSVVIQKAEPFT